MKIDKNYEKKVNKILKTYNSVLVKCKNIPTLSDKNIIMVDSIGGMVNAQIETRKPILYFQENICTSFMLLDEQEAYIYIVKANANIQSEVEHEISNFDVAKNAFIKEILSKVEKILLNVNLEKQNLLNDDDLKYLDSLKEFQSNQSGVSFNNFQNNTNANLNDNKENNDTNLKGINQNQERNNEQSVKHSNQNENNNSKNKENIDINKDNSKGLYLVPVKKKRFSLFGWRKKNKKSKRAI